MRIFSRLTAFLLGFGAAAMLAGCADPNISPVPFNLGSATSTVAVGPNLRIVSERLRAIPATGAILPTACAEPSPDVAIAFGRAFAANASYSQPSGPTASGAFNASQTELATALEGRTAGVLALRDGLSAACQAYVNGVIGQDAYALILSQYGNLLVALAGTGTAGSAPPKITAQETAQSALLVSCISAYDVTRLGGEPNPLLSPRRCGRLLDAIVNGKPPRVAKGDASAPGAVAGSTYNFNVK